MKLVKITDGVIIRRDSLSGYKKDKYDPRGCHYYIAVYNDKKKRYDMYPTSHYIDPAKQADVRNKRAILMKIKGVKGASTVYKIPRSKDVNGQPFRDDVTRTEYVGKLTPYQQKRLKNFIKKK